MLIILGSDKTTISVATGHTEYWPVYLSIGNIHNNARRAHKNGLVLLGFLAILKSKFSSSILVIWPTDSNLYQWKKKYKDDASYRKFCWQLLHTSLAKILDPLKPGMTTPEVARCPNGHYWRVIYGLSPYIANYPEQQSTSSFFQIISPSHLFLRCTAPQLNLNQMEGVTRRCQDHTELLVHELELGILWDGWGVVGDIVVRLLLPVSFFSFL